MSQDRAQGIVSNTEGSELVPKNLDIVHIIGYIVLILLQTEEN